MTRLRWIILMLLSPTMVCAQVSIPCLKVDWDFTASPRLGSFFVYTSRTSGQYPMAKEHPLDSRPVAILDAQPQMVTELSCGALRITQPGTWYAVVTAVSVDMREESPPSNEITITVKGVPLAPVHPPSPPASTPPPLVTLPPPLVAPGKPVGRLPPLPADGRGSLTETDVWRGVGAMPRTQPKAHGSRLTDTCVWQGRTCP